MWKHTFFYQRNCIEKSAWKQRGFFHHRNYNEKALGEMWIFQPQKLNRKNYVETTWIFWPLKLQQKKHMENMDIWDIWPAKLCQEFFNQWNQTEKSTWKQHKYLTIKITSKKVHGNDVDFSIIKIMSKKIHRNNVDYLIREITLKRYVEMTWKFVKIWPSTDPSNIDMYSTWCAHLVHCLVSTSVAISNWS